MIIVKGRKVFLTSESGVALIAVLWILLLLSMMAAGYTSSTRLRAVAAANQIEAIKSRYDEKSALEHGNYEYEKYVRNRNLLLQKDEIEGLTEKTVELWYPRYQPYLRKSEAGAMAIQIRFLESRFNVNTLPAPLWDDILSVCGIDDQEQRTSIRDTILDWIDADSLHHLQGAESEYYLEQTPEYYCKNNKIQVLDELLLLRGVTQDLYYGNSKHPGLVNFLSVYGSADKIDINSASPDVLLLLKDLEDDQRAAILASRQEVPFQKLSELAQFVAPDTYTQIKHYFKIVQPPAEISIAVSIWSTETKTEGWNYKIYREK